ncbi:MAG: hypothetical protein ACOYOK_12780, partial [Pseudobdellovibrionaceae bacterium]
IASGITNSQTRFEVNYEVPLLAGRGNVFLLEGRERLNVTLRQRAEAAPLIFVIAGLGGFATDGKALFLSELFYNAGFHVVTLPSGFNWQFSLSGSRTGLVGNTEDDVADYYEALKKVDISLKKQTGLKVTSYGIAGYSLGAYHSLYLNRIDEKQKVFNFKRVLMINSPVDLGYGLKLLDNYFANIKNIPPQRAATVDQRFFAVATKVKDMKDPDEVFRYLVNLERNKYFSEDEMKYIIGKQFHDSLVDIIFTTQQIRDLGVLKSPLSKWNRTARMNEIGLFNFQSYFEKLVILGLKVIDNRTTTFEDLIKNSNFYALKSYIQNNDKIFLVHNSNDFLLKTGDVDFLKESFGDRAVLFPGGGHCGNFWMPQNKAFMLKALKSGF